MQHKTHNKTINSPYVFLDIELLPDNEKEQKAITNVRNLSASQEDKALVENYLLFHLNAINIEWTGHNRAILKSSNV
jgi:hypothetical protein